MENEFSRILTLLRKEQGITQKKAAEDLHMSQALLSHYERGIRECGLDFLIRAAEYYGVSCDYLLGRTSNREGATVPIVIQDEEDASVPQTMLRGAQEVLFTLLQDAENEQLSEKVSEFLFLAVYRMFRVLYGANAKNSDTFFQLPRQVAPAFAEARMREDEAVATAIAGGHLTKRGMPLKDPSVFSMTTQSLTERFPNSGTALLALIKQCEEHLQKPSNEL